ncbi:copper-binding protein [Thioalkalivibrio denitrificans]|uniref:Copper-binding protein n=1 Tax=Thioalkalivibrio denitrificans TaxID=108003 RepID=A0A1V3NF86_9GAMM|nr:nitrous oxide reductase family maturation protein NosD [Thioalkalivibrio denitrificans]OOG23731.1 copper-binding protein [Thioalkalivibrio denitrificans]
MSIIRIFALLALFWAGSVSAADTPLRVAPGQLATALADAQPGAWLHLESGTHGGGVRVEVPLRLTAESDAVLDGDGQGRVLVVAAPDVVIQGLTLRNDGADLTAMDAAIFVEKQAERVRLIGNRIHARGFGIWLDGAPHAVVADNRISGDTALRSQDRGNGIHLFNVNHAVVAGNIVWEARDGIYIDVSNHNRLLGNTLHDQRYGIHYMFSHHNEVMGNRTRDNRAGFALMASRHLTVVGNRAMGDENYGFLLNDITYSTIESNTAIGIRHGTTPGTGGQTIAGAEGKALFVYNSQHNTIRDNLLAGTDIGVHLTAGSEGNRIYNNALVNNRSQVMYVATRQQEWSVDGRGNYWSDYVGWDLSGDGLGDVPHEPNDSVDRLLWKYPMARVLMNSPAIQLLRWVQRTFPVLRPPGVKDSAPLMRPTRSLEEVG